MTLGQGSRRCLRDRRRRAPPARVGLMAGVNMGGTAIGTGINAPLGYVDGGAEQ